MDIRHAHAAEDGNVTLHDWTSASLQSTPEAIGGSRLQQPLIPRIAAVGASTPGNGAPLETQSKISYIFEITSELKNTL
jgi:hypothetical protein